MKVTEYFEKSQDKTLVSFEVLPPLKGGTMKSIFDTLDPLMEFKPPFIDVTYHREEFIYNKQQSGFYEKIAIRKRPGTVGICAAIMHHYGIDAVPHLICGGFSVEETENALIDLHFLNIKNVLALRGDPRKFEDKFLAEPDGHAFALDLVKQISDMNNGIYSDKSIANGSQTDFCIGIAGYPEKHYESPNFDLDLKHTKKKIDAGAEYIVTQMFFNTKAYESYVEKCHNTGIKVPIVPGIKPITKKSQLTAIPRKFFIDLPEELVDEINNSKSLDAVTEVGIEWAVQQCKDLIKLKVPCIHFYTMGDWDTTKRIIEKAF